MTDAVVIEYRKCNNQQMRIRIEQITLKNHIELKIFNMVFPCGHLKKDQRI